ncbi:MAG: hypothetical protein C4516_00685 [Oxalobacter sp.]|nr:MAG: hypothetical protein C4516_00685 [Oxalobacter sp.]
MTDAPPAKLAPAPQPASTAKTVTPPAVVVPEAVSNGEAKEKINAVREKVKEIMQRAEEIADELPLNIDGATTRAVSFQSMEAQGVGQDKQNGESSSRDPAFAAPQTSSNAAVGNAAELLTIRQQLEQGEERQPPGKIMTQDKADMHNVPNMHSGDAPLPDDLEVRMPPMD